MRRLLWCLLAVATLAGLAPQASHGAQVFEGFRLQDWLGREWRNELVRFPAPPAALEHAKSGHALVGPEGRAVPYQIHSGAAPAIEFAADLGPFETRVYRFEPRQARVQTDLVVDENAEQIRIGNQRVGVAISRHLKGGVGPIAQVRLASGRWVGGSKLSLPHAVTSYSVEIVSRGPLAAEVVCRLDAGAGRLWTLRVRVQADEPVILLDESYSLGAGAVFDVDLSAGFEPDTLFYRYGRSAPDDANSVGRIATFKVRSREAQPLFVWEPWLHWWERERQGRWFGLYRQDERDLLAIGAREPGVWVDPAQPAALRKLAQIPLTLESDRLKLPLPLANGRRSWMIGAHDRDASLERWKRGNRQHAPLPQQYLIKHGDFPLNRVKDYVLEWNRGEAAGPRLLVQPAAVARLRERFRPDRRRLAELAKAQLSHYEIDDAIQYYLGTGDRALGRHLAATATRWVQESVDAFLRQDELTTPGFAPHHRTKILSAVNLADAIWSSELTPADRARLQAQLAFLAYTVNRPDYWSPERGYSANPNMTSTVAAYQTALGCMLREHPSAKAWVARGMRELKDNQLERWADENGGWLEAPHYAMLSYDYLLGAFLMTHNAGFNDHLFDPKMKKVIEWFAKISTPPEAGASGHRALPPIGNTLLREPSGEFGIVAALWKEKDPVFSAEMQWMYRQHGSFGSAGVGGFFPMLAGYRKVLVDAALPERAPAYRSELFPRTGVILRSGFPGERETQLHLIAGANHAHYDRDSGSITVWGKGRIVANDFGYYGEAPGEDHSMVVSGAAPDSALMNVVRFEASDVVDYVQGVKNDAWERAIVFMKGPALEPNYFVTLDRLRKGPRGTWRLWLTAARLDAAGPLVTARGKEDVDTDIYFVRPGSVSVKTESRTRQTYGTTAGKYGRVSTTQLGIVAGLAAPGAITTVLYPRQQTDKPAHFTAIADGRGVKVDTPLGSDYVFLSEAPFVYATDEVQFRGTVGALRVRAGGPVLWLGEPGTIAAGGKTLKRDEASVVRAQ